MKVCGQGRESREEKEKEKEKEEEMVMVMEHVIGLVAGLLIKETHTYTHNDILWIVGEFLCACGQFFSLRSIAHKNQQPL